MKKHLLLLLVTVSTVLASFAQSPQSLPYQAVARDAGGNLIALQPVSVRFTVHDGTAGGPVVYQETQSPTTSKLGLFNVNVGSGTVVSGTFSAINWAAGAKYLQVELDPTGGTSYINMGTDQIRSVAYALYAASGGSPEDATNEGSLTVTAGSGTTSVIHSNTSGSTDVTLQAGTNVSLSESGNTITINSSNPGGTVTSVGTSAPLTGGTITGIGTIGITQSSTSADGYLSSTDWNTFNNKVGGSGTSTRVAFWSGTNTLSSNGSLFWDNTNARLGIGTASPASTLSVGSSSQFQVGSTGNITKINNVAYSFPSAQGAANTFLRNDGAGNLSYTGALTVVADIQGAVSTAYTNNTTTYSAVISNSVTLTVPGHYIFDLWLGSPVATTALGWLARLQNTTSATTIDGPYYMQFPDPAVSGDYGAPCSIRLYYNKTTTTSETIQVQTAATSAGGTTGTQSYTGARTARLIVYR